MYASDKTLANTWKRLKIKANKHKDALTILQKDIEGIEDEIKERGHNYPNITLSRLANCVK